MFGVCLFDFFCEYNNWKMYILIWYLIFNIEVVLLLVVVIKKCICEVIILLFYFFVV